MTQAALALARPGQPQAHWQAEAPPAIRPGRRSLQWHSAPASARDTDSMALALQWQARRRRWPQCTQAASGSRRRRRPGPGPAGAAPPPPSTRACDSESDSAVFRESRRRHQLELTAGQCQWHWQTRKSLSHCLWHSYRTQAASHGGSPAAIILFDAPSRLLHSSLCVTGGPVVAHDQALPGDSRELPVCVPGVGRIARQYQLVAKLTPE